jgi:hypothetical protein
MPFDGATYDRGLDGIRLTGQLQRVFDYMETGQWRTIPEIASKVGGSEAAVSARLRDLRKPKFGGYLVEKRRVGDPTDGLWEYRLLLQAGSQQQAPQRLTHSDMKDCLTILRSLHGKLPSTWQPPIEKLGKWLASNVEGA